MQGEVGFSLHSVAWVAATDEADELPGLGHVKMHHANLVLLVAFPKIPCLIDHQINLLQAYGDAVQDECPLLLVSNYRSTFLLLRHTDVTNKRLKVAQWTWDDAGVPPLGAFLYVLKLASDLWHQGVKQQLSRLRVPVTPTEGYRLDLSGRAINLNAAWCKGHAQVASREQPERSGKRSRYGDDETHSSPTNSSPSSSSDTEAFSWFDATAAWEPSCMGVSSAAAVEALPVLPPSHVTCGPECLCSAPSRRIFKVSTQLGRGGDVK